MLKWLLRKFGYLKVDYGSCCGRYWIEIDGKVIAQTPGDDFYMRDEDVRNLAVVIIPDCVWTRGKSSYEWDKELGLRP